MTTAEFKKLKPEYENIDGDELWNAMEDYMLQQQLASEIIKPIMPIWKTHTLRWLYYRKVSNWGLGRPSKDKYASNKRCSSCKNGVNARMGIVITQEDGSRKYVSYCPHCGAEYNEESNTNFSHKVYIAGQKAAKLFWLILDKLHLVRSSVSGRYAMFGDEMRYVVGYDINLEKGTSIPILKKRKWWQYIIIEKPTHNF